MHTLIIACYCAQNCLVTFKLMFKCNYHTPAIRCFYVLLDSSNCWSHGQQRSYKTCSGSHCWKLSIRQVIPKKSPEHSKMFQSTLEQCEGHHQQVEIRVTIVKWTNTGCPSRDERHRWKLIRKAAKRPSATLKELQASACENKLSYSLHVLARRSGHYTIPINILQNHPKTCT